MKSAPRVVVIGAGVGGLTAAALLLKNGCDVTVLEAHVYPGGSAGTFYHQGFRFDAGATLVGGFAVGGPHARLGEWLGLEWPVQPIDPAWVVQIGEERITQWADAERWREERQQKLPGSEPFWQKQEQLARISWCISSQAFPWPPQNVRNGFQLASAFRPWLLPALPYLLSPVSRLFPRPVSPLLKTFVDAQLLISAQTTAEHASALYGSAALDLPRRGVNWVRGGVGGIARTLADWITAHGGQILYRQKVEKIETRSGQAVGLRTNKRLELGFDLLVANLTPWGLAALLGEAAPGSLRKEVQRRESGWGAFVLHLGVQQAGLQQDAPTHTQVVMDPDQPLGEGNSVFISVSEAQDDSRAPAGERVLTISTHTRVDGWWQLLERDPDAYAARKADYTERVLRVVEQVYPQIRPFITLNLAGTPVTYQRFTRRPLGMVGGFAQTSLLAARAPQTGLENAWLVGDSVFPGQSTAGVTLGAMRVVDEMLHSRI